MARLGFERMFDRIDDKRLTEPGSDSNLYRFFGA
jgi:hypothetical protein